MARQRFGGIYPILYAFFREDGRLDHEAMRTQVEHCVRTGAHGIAVLGLVTEVGRLSTAERGELVEVVGAAIAGRVPYAVTIGEPTEAGQIEFARMAARNGASWVVLQPPAEAGITESELIARYGRIAEAASLPVAVQNNPVNLAVSLSPEGLVRLARAVPQVTILKAEGSTLDIAPVIEAMEGTLDVFGGHGGIEYPMLVRAGAAGLIPAPDLLASQLRLHALLKAGDPASVAEAERIHRAILPLIVFMTRSIAHLVVYGKLLMARRLRLPTPTLRPPSRPPSAFGLAELERLIESIEAVDPVPKPAG